jgi:two-component system OmpR family response regulator/two-component system alkaline phosphatase synthesis response regulator PhoP
MTKARTIVVIDDDAVILKILSIVLSHEDIRLSVASDAKTGYRMVENENPCLVILDVHMPGQSGLNLLNEMRHNPRTCDTPVLMLTSDSRLKGLAADLGADAYMTKPFKPVELRQKISDLLHH